MNHSLNIHSQGNLTDLLILLVAAFIKVISLALQCTILLVYAFYVTLRRDQTGVLETVILAGIGLFLFNLLAMCGYL